MTSPLTSYPKAFSADRPADEPIVYSAAHASGVLLALGGMACQWAFLHIVTFLGSVTIPQHTPAPIENGWFVNIFCTSLLFLGLFLAAPRIGPLIQKKALYRISCAFIALGLLTMLAGRSVLPPVACVYLENICISLGSAPLIVMWGELYRYLNPQREQLLVTVAAAALAIVLYLVAMLLPPPLFVVSFIAMPAGSIGCLYVSHSLLAGSSDTWKAPERTGMSRSPLLLYVCIAIFTIPYNYLRNTEQLQIILSDVFAWPSVLAIAVMVVVAVGIAEYLAERKGLVVIPGCVLLLLSAALLVHLLGPDDYPSLVPSLLYSGYYLLLSMIYLSIGPIVATTEENSTRIFSEAMLFNSAGLILGSMIAEAEQWLGVHSATLTVLGITYVVLIAGFILLGNRSYSLFRVNSFDEENYSFEYVSPLSADAPAATEQTRKKPGEEDGEAPPATMLGAIVEQCAFVGETFRLSTREQQVLVELVRGRTIASIAETLTVSENTVKAHTKNIYRKLGVHTREELLNRVEETGRDTD